MDGDPGAPLGARESAAAPRDAEATRIRSITSPEELSELHLGDLSDWFNPFLEHFMAESLRCGGEVAVAESGSRLTGIYLFSPAERIASVFTRSPEIADAFRRRREGGSMYTPFAPARGAETYLIYSRQGPPPADRAGFAHGIRIAVRSDLPRVTELLGEVYGEVDARWIETMPAATERCFLAEVDGALAGVAWASLVHDAGRLHSLSVRPRFRRLGIGWELFRARRLWLGAAGAARVLSEIAERNGPSRRIAERGGMAVIGQIYRLDPPTGAEPRRAT
jgi:GNAT superfamily N-acetyltransferase